MLFDNGIGLKSVKGLIKNDELFNRTKIHVNQKYWKVLKTCHENWYICMKSILHVKSFCEYLKNRSYHLYIVSNANNKFYSYFERLLFLSCFTGMLVSSDIKMIKPDLEIYQYILSKYQLIVSECLLIDDLFANI